MELLLVLAGGVNRLVEFIKVGFLNAIADRYGWSEDIRHAVTLFLSLLFGVIAAFGGNVTIASLLPENPYTAAIPVWIGTVVMGLLVGLGSNAIHALVDFIETLRGRVEAPAAELGVQPNTATRVYINSEISKQLQTLPKVTSTGSTNVYVGDVDAASNIDMPEAG